MTFGGTQAVIMHTIIEDIRKLYLEDNKDFHEMEEFLSQLEAEAEADKKEVKKLEKQISALWELSSCVPDEDAHQIDNLIQIYGEDFVKEVFDEDYALWIEECCEISSDEEKSSDNEESSDEE